MKIFRTRSLSEYDAHFENIQEERASRTIFQKELSEKSSHKLKKKVQNWLKIETITGLEKVSGYSYTAAAYVDFIIPPRRPVNYY